MISTTDLTAYQLEQLAALLADTTPGGGVYRPPVARDEDVLRQFEDAGLARVSLVRGFEDIGYENWEITDAGKAVVVDRAMDAADTEAFLRYASRHELRETIRRLKDVFPTLVEDHLRERTLLDIEACQDRLDDLAEGQSEGTGRHRLVPVDDRPTEVLPAAVEQTAIEKVSGTLPGLPVVAVQPDVLGSEYYGRLRAAIIATPTEAEIAEINATQAALEADLGDDVGWWNRSIVPGGVLVVSLLAAVAITWFAAWLVMGR